MRRMMASAAILAVILTSFSILIPDIGIEGKITRATLSKGAQLSFSYDLRNVENTATKTGTLTALVTEVEWRGYDSFMFNGTMTGTFWTQSGSGTESGTWTEYYRKGDLAFLDQTYVTDMVIGANTVTNTTNVHYAPSLNWIEFPLEYVNGPDKSIWSTSGPVSITSTWERIINGDEETSESGSDKEELDYDWICADKVTKDVGAGSFETYWIREWVRDDSPRNQMTDYFYNETVGWWVQKDIYVDDDQGGQVRIKHYELTKTTINKGPQVVSSPKVTMNEDATDRSVDLDYVFSDPDGDPLTYKVMLSPVLSSSIDLENRLVVEPPKDHSGNESVIVSAQDALNAPVTLNVHVEVRPVDDPPVLSQPSLYPLTGDETTLFTYSITVADIDTAEPSSAEVMIDSYYYDLTKVSGDNKTGMLFHYTVNLGPGEHYYGFRVDGVQLPSSGDLNGPTVIAYEDPYLKQGSVSPSNGNVNTFFTFKVTWVGPNGEVPDSVRLVIDGSSLSMTGDGSDPVSGRTFSSSMKLSEGDHSFHFEAGLGEDQFRFPQSGNLDGPVVAGLDEPYLSGGIVTPEEGGLSTDFTFEVTWTGPNGESPSRTVVVLDGETISLSKRSGSPTKGVVYAGLMKVGEGDHSFYFKSTYGDGELRFPKVGSIDGPIVRTPELVSCGYQLVSEADRSATYIFHASYEYMMDVYPTEAQVEINGIDHDLTIMSGSPPMGLNCSREVTLSEGNYTVDFRLVVDGMTLTSRCDVLKVQLGPDDTPDDTDDDDTDGDDDGPDGSDQNGDIVIIVVLGVVLIALVSAIAILMMRRKGGRERSGSEGEEEFVVTSSRGRK